MKNGNCHVFEFKISVKFMTFSVEIIRPHAENLNCLFLITCKTRKQLEEQLIQYVARSFISHFILIIQYHKTIALYIFLSVNDLYYIKTMSEQTSY